MRILSRTIKLADMRLLILDPTCPALMGCICYSDWVLSNPRRSHACRDGGGYQPTEPSTLPEQRRYPNVGLGISLGLAAFLIVVDQVES